MFTEQEKITILMRDYGDRKRTYDEVAYLFNETYSNRDPISKAVVWGIVKLQTFVENHGTSIREVALQHDVSVGSVHNVLKINKFRCYKILFVQELSDDDFDRRLEFSEIIMRKADVDPNFTNKIVFSD